MFGAKVNVSRGIRTETVRNWTTKLFWWSERSFRIAAQEGVQFRIEAACHGKDRVRGREVDDFRIFENISPQSTPAIRPPFLEDYPTPCLFRDLLISAALCGDAIAADIRGSRRAGSRGQERPNKGEPGPD